MQCPACQHENPAGQKFCGECGARLVASPTPAQASVHPSPAAPPAPRERFASPAAYTPRHLAEKILTSRSAIEGERKQVTVVFTDVSGFTPLSEALDPEEVHAIMDRAFEVILNAVHRYEGTVNQFLGDGVMALFGAPIAHEDHASRALSAALTIMRELAPVREHVKRQHGRDFLMRIGINTGPVVVGAIGRDLRMDYTAVGDTTNLAARLMTLAKPGQIVVSRYTQHLRDGYFVFSDLGDVMLKGKTLPIRAYELTDEVRGKTRLEVSKDRGLTPLVGRAAELERLRAAHRSAVAGAGLVVLLVGEPGQGKSRLLYEFLRATEHDGDSVECTCLSYGSAMPYHPILDALRHLFGLIDGMGEDEIRQRLADGLRSLGLDESNATDLLAHFMGVSVPAGFLARIQATQVRDQTLSLVREVFLGSSARRPLVLVVENVHWIDASSAALLETLALEARRHALLLVMSTRPEANTARLPTPDDTIQLTGLADDHRREMVLALLGVRAATEELFETVLARAEGNPLYVEEILRQLTETEGVVIREGRAELRTTEARVPATIHDIIAARVDRLDQALKASLQPASVIGRQFAVSLLERVAPSDDDVPGHLRDLATLDFVFPSALEPEAAYTFKHALTQDVVYGSLLLRRRRQYHEVVGAALEELAVGRPADVAELLAYHYGRSDNAEKAIDYAILAGEQAQRRWAHAEALTHFEAALTRLAPLPDSEANRLRRIDAVLKQAEIKFALGRHAEQIAALEEIRALVESVDDPGRQAAWYCWAGHLHSLVGSPPDVAIAYCRRALDIAEHSGFEEYVAFALCSLTLVTVVAGDLRAAVEAGTRAVPVFERYGNLWWACRTLWGLSMAFNAIGEWDRSLECCRRGLAHGEALRDLRLKVVALYRMGSTHIQRGDAKAGLACCEEALSLSAPFPFDTPMIKAAHSLGLVKAGHVERGITEMEEVMAWFDRSRLRYTHSLVAVWLAETWLRQGDRTRARPLIEAVLATSRESGYRHFEGLALRLLGECLATDDPAAAREALSAAEPLLKWADARNDLGKLRAAQAVLAHAAGADPQARELFEHALEIFTSLGTLDEPRRVRALVESL